MQPVDIFAVVVLLVLVLAVIAVFIALGRLPGQIAEKRGHAQADAVRVAGWIGVITLGLTWPLALIWAYMRPRTSSSAQTAPQKVSNLRARIDALEARLPGDEEASA